MDSCGHRAVLYSHDAMGIGHIRRNLLIASALTAADPRAQVLLVTGVQEASSFSLPPNVDCLTLPALRKDANGRYQSRRLRLTSEQLLALRSRAIHAAVSEFRPDVLIVDKHPRGVGHELDATLEWLRNRSGARCVLGLRDILDDNQVIQREWHDDGNIDVIDGVYDAVWVYGDPIVYDTAVEYRLPPSIIQKISYTGYLDGSAWRNGHGQPGSRQASSLQVEKTILCMVGGGEDGAELAQAFADARAHNGACRVLLTGPFLPAAVRSSLERRAIDSRDFRVLPFVPEPWDLIRGAERVVTMGGYNSVMEVLCAGRPALIVPRTAPRREQWIRARRLAQLGLADLIEPERLTAEALSEWMNRPIRAGRDPRAMINFNGLSNIPRLLQSLVGSDRRLVTERTPFRSVRVAV